MMPDPTTREGGGAASRTLRDEFAMAALQGMIASDPVVDRKTVNRDVWARVAYEFADAMLRARESKPNA